MCSHTGWRSRGRSRLSAAFDECCPTRTLAGAGKVDPTVNGPNQRDAQGQQRLHLGAITHERPDQIKAHARKVGKQPEGGDKQVADNLELRMVVETNQARNATQPIKQERSEVRGKGNGKQRIGQSRHFVVGCVPETGPEAMRQCLYGGVRWRAGIAEGHNYRDTTDYGRNRRQSPDRSMRCKVLSMQQAEVLRHLLVFSHGVSNARPGVHAGERGADQCKKHRARAARLPLAALPV